MLNYSFIIPHHNSPKLLDRCLDSIPLRKDLEVIVVDDNSEYDKQPNTSRSDVQIIKISQIDSRGAGKARNIGMSVARGKWLLFADCDDFYETGFLEELDKYVDSNIDILFFDAYFNINLQTGICHDDDYHQAIKSYKDNPNSKSKAMVMHMNNATWCRMYNHDFIKKIGVLYEEVPMGNDVWFVQYASSKAKKIEVVDKKLYYYVATPGSITKGKKPKKLYIEKIIRSEKYYRLKVNSNAKCCIRSPFLGLRKYKEAYGIGFMLRCFFLQLYIYIKVVYF